jgi:SAM-dependent methyltransferase
MNSQKGNKLKNIAKRLLNTYGSVWCLKWLLRSRYYSQRINRVGQTIWGKNVKSRVKLRKNRRKTQRYLEIGPGNKLMPGFETLNIVGGLNVDYVFDAAKPLPFQDNAFHLVYASHVLEHIPWYQIEGVLREWVRILKPGGHMEIWVPDAIKICKAFVDAEVSGNNYIDLDGWYKFNPEKDPCVWASGRIYTYGDGVGDPRSPNWHKALFSPRYLALLMGKVGLTDIVKLAPENARGEDHGWISLGQRGTKP